MAFPSSKELDIVLLHLIYTRGGKVKPSMSIKLLLIILNCLKKSELSYNLVDIPSGGIIG